MPSSTAFPPATALRVPASATAAPLPGGGAGVRRAVPAPAPAPGGAGLVPSGRFDRPTPARDGPRGAPEGRPGFGLLDAASGDDSDILSLPKRDFFPPDVLPAAIADNSLSVYAPDEGPGAAAAPPPPPPPSPLSAPPKEDGARPLLLPPPPLPLPLLLSELLPRLDPLAGRPLSPPRALDRRELGRIGTLDPEPGRLGPSGGRGGVAIRPPRVPVSAALGCVLDSVPLSAWENNDGINIARVSINRR